MGNSPEFSLATTYYVQEIPGAEAEAKLLLLNNDPLGFLLTFEGELQQGDYQPFRRQMAMGTQPVGIQTFAYNITYFGKRREDGQIEEAFGLIRHPTKDRWILKRKDPAKQRVGGVSLREEHKYGIKEAMTGVDVNNLLSGENFYQMPDMERARYSFYATSGQSYRNFNICADTSTCFYRGKKFVMSQLEIEYKGRSGIVPGWGNAFEEISNEILLLRQGIKNRHPGIIQETNLTKFNWLQSLL